jgi:hypothetical protein
MRTSLRLASIVFIYGVSVDALAQSAQPLNAPPQTSPTLATEAYRARSSDDMALRSYAWSTRLELFKGGKLVDQMVSRQTWLPDGRLQRVVTNGNLDDVPPEFINKAADYLADLRDRLQVYRPTAGALMNFLTAVKPRGPDASGALIASGKNVVVPGDSVTLWLDATTKRPRRLQVTTTFQDDPIQVKASFATLPEGPTYMEFVQVNIPEKQAEVLVQNYNYSKMTKD